MHRLEPMRIPCAVDLCNAEGCINDRMPGSAYCRRCSRSKTRQLEDLNRRQQAAKNASIERMLVRVRPQLYAIALNDTVKFGISAKPRDRLTDLQISLPITLSLLGHVPCERELEREVHEYCAEERIRGEWFRRVGRAAEIEALIVAGDPMPIYERVRRPEIWVQEF